MSRTRRWEKSEDSAWPTPPCMPQSARLRTADGYYKLLKTRTKKPSQICALQRKPQATRHLATECTRYAHYYPQILWKKAPRQFRGAVGKPCWMRVAEHQPDASGVAAHDGASAGS